MNEICLKLVNSGDFAKFDCLKCEKLDFSDFVSATRGLSPNSIKLKKCLQKVFDSPSILKKCMIFSRKRISYEYNSENLDKRVDLRKFHKYEQISRTQRS